MYIDVFDATERKLFLTVIGSGNEARGFRIKVTQLGERQAPPDCLQYYEGLTGMIKTFNYDEISRVVRHKIPSYFVSFSYLLLKIFFLMIYECTKIFKFTIKCHCLLFVSLYHL